MLQQSINTLEPIASDGLCLRPLRASDAEFIDLYASNEGLAWHTSAIPHPLPAGFGKSVVASSYDPGRIEDIWVMDASESGLCECAGLISLSRLGFDQSDIAYWTGMPFWGSGLASAAVQALLLANPQYCRTIFASVFQDNPVSARVLTNCGFQYIGDAESYSVARGVNVATWTYAYTCR